MPILGVVDSSRPKAAFFMSILASSGTLTARSITFEPTSKQPTLVGSSSAASSMMFTTLANPDASTNIVLQKNINVTTSNQSALKVVYDSVNSRWIVYGQTVAGGFSTGWVARITSTGTIDWQYYLSGAATLIPTDMCLDTSGNIYVTGSLGADAFLMKINNGATPSIAWQKNIAGATAGNDRGYSVCLDSSGFVFLAMRAVVSTGQLNIILTKFNSSNGNFSFMRQYDGNSDIDTPVRIVCNSLDDVIITGQCGNTTGISPAFIMKVNNSNGSILWQRNVTRSNQVNNMAGGICVDANNNYYGLMDVNLLNNAGLLAKWDNNGTLQWTRLLTCGSAALNFYANSLEYSASSINLVGAVSASVNRAFYARFKDDGTGTGTVSLGGVSYTYATDSTTDIVGTMTDSANGATVTNSTMTLVATTYTIANPSPLYTYTRATL